MTDCRPTLQSADGPLVYVSSPFLTIDPFRPVVLEGLVTPTGVAFVVHSMIAGERIQTTGHPGQEIRASTGDLH